jgi:hypothetical protein
LAEGEESSEASRQSFENRLELLPPLLDHTSPLQSEQIFLLSLPVNDLFPNRFGECRKGVGFATIFHDMADRPTTDEKRIREQPAMAAPGHGFGAHQGDTRFPCDRFHFVHDRIKLRRGHKVGVGAKRRHSPSDIRRIGRRFAKAAEIAAPKILNAIG